MYWKRLHNNFNFESMENIKNIKDSINVVDMYEKICEEIMEFIEAENM